MDTSLEKHRNNTIYRSTLDLPNIVDEDSFKTFVEHMSLVLGVATKWERNHSNIHCVTHLSSGAVFNYDITLHSDTPTHWAIAAKYLLSEIKIGMFLGYEMVTARLIKTTATVAVQKKTVRPLRISR